MGLGDAVVLGAAALLPVALLSLTSFVKISVVLSLLRSALGTPDAPSSLVIMGLSLLLSGVVMAPVLQQMALAAAQSSTVGPAVAPTGPRTVGAPPASGPQAESWRALVPAARQREVAAALAAIEPLRAFLVKHVDPADRASFIALARSMGRSADDVEFSILAPAFVTSELKRAFLMAIVLLLPFLVIDVVVGLTLTALGATAMSPQSIALPLKLLLFVAVDGWRLLVESLLRAYS
jgi:type III secretion protein R